MNNQSLLTKFLIAIGVQIVIVLLFLAYNHAIIASGKDVYLRALPVDPTDLLRGDYVVIRYGISEVYPYQFENGEKPLNGQVVYAPVKDISGQDGYIAGQILLQEPSEELKNDEADIVYLRGVVLYGGIDMREPDPLTDPFSTYPTNLKDDYSPVTISYGIEEKFVAKGRGNLPMDADIISWVKVSDDGVARIHKLFVDGKEWK